MTTRRRSRPWFRCPFGGGDDDPRVLGALEALGYRNVDWDVELEDWEPWRTARDRAGRDRRCRAHGDGAIVLLHTWPGGTAEALPPIVDGLRARGRRWWGVDQLGGARREAGGDARVDGGGSKSTPCCCAATARCGAARAAQPRPRRDRGDDHLERGRRGPRGVPGRGRDPGRRPSPSRRVLPRGRGPARGRPEDRARGPGERLGRRATASATTRSRCSAPAASGLGSRRRVRVRDELLGGGPGRPEVRFPATGTISGDWGGGRDIGAAALAALRAEDGRASRRRWTRSPALRAAAALAGGRGAAPRAARERRVLELAPLVFHRGRGRRGGAPARRPPGRRDRGHGGRRRPAAGADAARRRGGARRRHLPPATALPRSGSGRASAVRPAARLTVSRRRRWSARRCSDSTGAGAAGGAPPGASGSDP